ncbi:MAG: UTP--glucose-1-phosphate uridylyltransferase [Dehalococcoidia bacterium]|nr:UTP--glucose-1-phosphate uridylyltransferase [Bacillota bacterium]
MKAIILSAGYAKRLWPLTRHMPKALLPIDGKPIIDFIIEETIQVRDIDRVIITTNLTFENHFRYWLRGLPQEVKSLIKIVVEPTTSEEDKLGAVGSIGYVIEQEDLVDDDLLIIAGDNLFEFQLADFIDFYKLHKRPVVAFRDLKDVNNVKGKYGVGILDGSNKVIGFQEKPTEPKSTLASTGCYLYPAYVPKHVRDYLKGKNDRDAPGHFIKWLCSQTDVYGFVFDEAWYDIGSFESYDRANEHYKGRVRLG